MNTKFIAGMLITVSLTGQLAFAAGQAKTTVRETLIEYTATAKKSLFGKSSGAKGISAQAALEAQGKIIKELKLTGGKDATLKMALSDSSKGAQRMDSLATIIAAKKMSPEIAKVDAVQAKSIEQAADASAKLIANSILTGDGRPAKDLTPAEKALVTEALLKTEAIVETIITKFENNERDSWTAVINKHDSIIESGAKATSEEALVQAIMDVKKVDKTKALELVKKLKECV